MVFDFFQVFSEAINYIQNNIVSGALSGDPTSIAMIGTSLLFLLIFVFKISGWFLGLIKRLFLVIIVVFSGYLFFQNYLGGTLDFNDPMVVGLTVIGALILAIAVIISFTSIGSHAKKRKINLDEEMDEVKVATKEVKQRIAELELERDLGEKVSSPVQQSVVEPVSIAQPSVSFFSAQGFKNQLTNDRSLLAVLSYVIIAEFGVFSSKTLPAPAVDVGLAFAAIFFIGAFVFIKTSYSSYVKGVFHLFIAGIFGLILSIVLAHFWGAIPLETLLSINYFRTDALVAFVTGIAVSLLMGSKG